MAVTRSDLDQFTCEHVDHEPDACVHPELYIHARCHPATPTWTKYVDGTVIVECSECHRHVAVIEVAP